MRSIQARRSWLVLPLIAVVAILVAATAASAGAAPAKTGPAAAVPQQVDTQPGAVGCTLSRDPAEPLEMNTVFANGLFKTVAMEKEIFNCTDATGHPSQIRDVETFIELVQDSKKVIEVRTEMATCVKDFTTGQVKCGFKPLELGKTDAPLKGCDPTKVTVPADPVVMNTAVGPVIKTVKVEKEVLVCEGGAAGQTQIRDLYLFTEIIESLQKVNGVATYRPTARRFLGIVCTKIEAAGTVTGCQRFAP